MCNTNKITTSLLIFLAASVSLPCVVSGLVADVEPFQDEIIHNPELESLAPVKLEVSSLEQGQAAPETNILLCTGDERECLISRQESQTASAPSSGNSGASAPNDATQPQQQYQTAAEEPASGEPESQQTGNLSTISTWGNINQQQVIDQPAKAELPADTGGEEDRPATITVEARAPAVVPTVEQEEVSLESPPATQTLSSPVDEQPEERVLPVFIADTESPQSGALWAAGYSDLINAAKNAGSSSGAETWVMVMAAFGLLSYLLSYLTLYRAIKKPATRRSR